MAARDIAIVAGYFARCPLGGYAWQVLHYVVGFEELGFETYFYEDTALYPDCFDPVSRNVPAPCDRGVDTLGKFFSAHGLSERWSFWEASTDRWFGRDSETMRSVVQSARLVVTLAPVTRLPWVTKALRVFIDLDPGYTQFRLVQGDSVLREFLNEHQRHFSIGERIGRPSCTVPPGGFEWLPTRQPIITRLWKTDPPSPDAPFTTVGRWHEERRDVVTPDQRYGWSKREEWQRFLHLPRLAPGPFLLAMDVAKYPHDYDLLRRHGWEIVDPLLISADPFRYRQFLWISAGEFTTAKDLNVRLRTGWFSDRSACYLAAGRPVVTQPTGFEELYPVGRGLFAVDTPEAAAKAIGDIRSAPAEHSRAAAEIAAQYFEAQSVLQELVSRL